MSKPPQQPEHDDSASPDEAPQTPLCMDCSTALSGTYCYVCGQRKQRRVASVYSLFREYLSGLLEWDSRVWRTLWPLFTKPGYLTKTYMEGKRERHSPPVRLYLISSIIFFLLISVAPKNFLGKVSDAIDSYLGDPDSGLEMGLDSPISTQAFGSIVTAMNEAGELDVSVKQNDDPDAEDDTEPDSDENPNDATDSVKERTTPERSVVVLGGQEVLSVEEQETLRQAMDAAQEALEASESAGAQMPSSTDMEEGMKDTLGVDGTEAVANSETNTRTDTEADTDTETDSEDSDGDSESESDNEIDLTDVQIVTECEETRTMEYAPQFEWLRTPAYRFCKSISTWRGLLTFLEELVERLPTTMLIILPLMALLNKLLYLFARRYYVEHLLFYVHNYSFLFLFTVVLVSLSTVLGWLGLGLGGLLGTLGVLYSAYYFLKSMRVVYDQGRTLTIIKWMTLLICFFILLLLVLVALMLATAAARGL